MVKQYYNTTKLRFYLLLNDVDHWNWIIKLSYFNEKTRCGALIDNVTQSRVCGEVKREVAEVLKGLNG